MSTAFQEDAKPLLRPHQVDDMQDEARRIEGALSAPPHIRAQLQEPALAVRQLGRIKHQLETQTPRSYAGHELDEAVKYERRLREEILQGMPTQAEMRRNPPGAVDKHRSWEKRNKERLQRWKNARLRLHASGALGELSDARDIANFERFRPAGGSHELAMDGAQIAGQDYYLPPSGVGPATVLTDEDKAVVAALDPELAERLAVLSNEQRAEVKAIIERTMVPANDNTPAANDNEPPEKEKQPRRLSEWNRLQKQASDLGISIWGKNREDLEREVQAKLAAEE